MSDLISLTKMQEWFKEQTEDSVKRVRNNIQKKLEGIQDALDDLVNTSQEFEVKDTVDAESRSSQNIYEKMTLLVEEFQFPKQITYARMREFQKEVEKLIKNVLTTGRRFIPNLGKKYKTRVFLLNRALKRIQKAYKDFSEYLDENTDLMQEVDETSDKISLLIKKMNTRADLQKRIQEEEEDAEEVEEQISEIDEDASHLEAKKVMLELEEIDKEAKLMGKKIRQEIYNLDKPLRKLASRAIDGVVQLPPHLTDLANNLRDNPEEAFWNLEEGHENLNELLQILLDAIEEDKIKIKRSKARKTVELAEEIIGGSIAEAHNEMLALKRRKEELNERINKFGLEEQIEKYQEKIEDLQKADNRKRRRIRDLEEELENLNEEIIQLAGNVQRKVRKLTEQDVKIDLKE
ncbi:MAG: hypothetical protein GF308_18640 [Candidatus Heimdallarchaeota archaeon]|nr:hypothetical protein [Candidatus Heimdallarchaeota archaeon]